MFFSEEKNQETFTSGSRGKIEAMGRALAAGAGIKSFGSFLQERTSCF
jgi:hypothetical protein